MATFRGDAPGRVNLIGEHTDHQGGLVLPVALPQRAHVEVEPRADRRVRVESVDVGANERVREHVLGAEKPTGRWNDHVQGVTAALGALLPAGFDARITSDVPIGAGLGSSAALAVALLRALREAFALPIEDRSLALLAHHAETRFVGARVGLMDQLAATYGREREALLIDTGTLAREAVPLPDELAFVVIDSGVRHEHASGEYNRRVEECASAARALDVRDLRAVTDVGRVDGLREPLRRRARHVVSENGRVREAVAALRQRDLAALGALLDASHRSLREDFEVSTPELDLLVTLARARPGVVGARLVGGGFGGSVLAIARGDAAAAAAARDAAGEYERRSGRRPAVLLPA